MLPLIPQELLALRQQMYEAHSNYLRNWSAYTAVPPQARTPAGADACRTTGALLTAALLALIEYLEPIQARPDRADELQRAKTIQATVRRELALIAKATPA